MLLHLSPFFLFVQFLKWNILQDAYNIMVVVVSCVLCRHGVPSLYGGSFLGLREDWLPQRCQWKHHCHGASKSAGENKNDVCLCFLTQIYDLLNLYDLLWKRKWDVRICYLSLSNALKLLIACCCFRTVTGNRWTPVTLCSKHLMERPSTTKAQAPSIPLLLMRQPIMKNNRHL